MAETEQQRPEGLEEGTDWARLALIVVATVGFGVWVGLSVLAVVLALVFMIFMHELGHYLTARAAGMKVTEFFIGFGPKLWSFRRGETEYGLKAIPAGAYVKIIGMSNLEEVDPADEARTYRQKPYWRRMSVALAGSTMHFLMAFVLIFSVLVAFGFPQENAWKIGEISGIEGEGSPAQEAGLQPDDRILEVDGRDVSEDYLAFREYLRARPGEEVELLVERDGRELTLTPRLAELPVEDGEPVGFLGIRNADVLERRNPIAGAVEAVRLTGTTMWESLRGLAGVFSPSGISGYVENLTNAGQERADDGAGADAPEGEDRLVSIYGVVRLGDTVWQSGLANFLTFLFAINIFIGLFNLVPLLPFDGGHVAVATYERLRERGGRRYFADVSKLMPLTYAVVLVLGFIFVSSIFLDIADPIQLQ